MRNARTIPVAMAALILACNQERRELREIPPAASPGDVVPASELRAGGMPVSESTSIRYGKNAYALGQGQKLFHRMNCVGCHFHGGGGIGPALIDDEWIYGSDPAQIYRTIVEGRPNGMPSFNGKLDNQQVWQLVAYVRSLSGLEGTTSSASREDHMFLSPNLATRSPQKPIRAKGGGGKP